METISKAPSPPGSRRNLQVGLVWMAGFACLPSLLLGIEWLTATASLGHPPIPSVNDPKSISPLSGALHNLTAISFPVALFGVLGSGGLTLSHRSPTKHRLTVVFSALFFLVGSIALFFGVPSDDLIGWWLD